MDRYMILANAIVKRAADDYFELLADIMPVPIPPNCNLAEIERFFTQSGMTYCARLTLIIS